MGNGRSDGGIDGRRRLTVASCGESKGTSSAECSDEGPNAAIARDRDDRIWRCQCTQILERGGARRNRCRALSAERRRSAERRMGRTHIELYPANPLQQPSGRASVAISGLRRGGWRRSRQGEPLEQGRGPGSVAGHARVSPSL